jgi:UDP-N-acetylmuramate--L-alanine ligase/UDP-N-acetylenolpyruvoylglucosamine reductase
MCEIFSEDDILDAELLEASALLTAPAGGIHMIGIGGVGMAGLALQLKALGFDVSGCDSVPGPLTDWLHEQNISVQPGHHADHIQGGLKALIRTAAVRENHEECTTAKLNGVPVIRRGAVLPVLVNSRSSIAVRGTHGKTTTTAMIAWILMQNGNDPSYCVGAELSWSGGCSAVGHGEGFVCEADESDGTLRLYSPEIGVITNVEFDHMEHFASQNDFEVSFECFAKQCRTGLVFNHDDPVLTRIARLAANGWSFGLTPEADFFAEAIQACPNQSTFTIHDTRNKESAVMTLPIPGKHNVLNALAAVCCGVLYGLSLEEAVSGLAGFELPGRRFELIEPVGQGRVISDYAHHPTEIRALIETASLNQANAGRLIGIFQPHRYTRTHALKMDFPESFDGLDELVLLPVYAASEDPLEGGTSWDLYQQIRKQEIDLCYAETPRAAWEYCRDRMTADDTLLIIGAGDVVEITEWVHEDNRSDWLNRISDDCRARLSPESRIRVQEPLGTRTGMAVGGQVDLLADCQSPDDLVGLLHIAKKHALSIVVIGAGRNTLIRDTGFKGVVVRLVGSDFTTISFKGNELIAGGGVPLNKLASQVEQAGFGGYEWLTAVPGTIGGAVRMNAGAYGSDMSKHVLWVTILDTHTCEVRTLPRDELAFHYRACSSVVDHIVLSAGFALDQPIHDESRALKARIAEERAWQARLRTVGSIFKNPEGHFAGALIEEAGLKGFCIGGARFSERHANFITTEPGANASDVLALIDLARNRVRRQFQVELITEVVILG